MATLYVGNLPKYTNEKDLAALFGRYGIVGEIKLGHGRGKQRQDLYGFVHLQRGDVDNAVRLLDHNLYDGEELHVRKIADGKARAFRFRNPRKPKGCA